MKISILTVTRNDVEGVRRTLASVRGQNIGSDIEPEHVVVDSSDAELAPKVREACGADTTYIWTPPEGIYPAINRALAACTGEIIGILNGGDVYSDSNALAHVAETFIRSKADYILADVKYAGSIRYYSASPFSVEALERGSAPPHPGFYARREVYGAIGNYNEKYGLSADFELFARLLKHPELKGEYLPEPLVVMAPGGVSQKFYNRLFVNSREKYQVLKEQGFRANMPRICMRIFPIIYTQFLFRPKK